MKASPGEFTVQDSWIVIRHPYHTGRVILTLFFIKTQKNTNALYKNPIKQENKVPAAVVFKHTEF